MTKYNKVDAFIKMAAAVTEGHKLKANQMSKIIGKSIGQERKENEYVNYIRLSREEKKVFSR